MSETIYPSREHGNADKAARRRALAAVDGIVDGALAIRKEVERGIRVDADDAQGLADNFRKLVGHLAEIGTLHDVRERDAAGRATAESWPP